MELTEKGLRDVYRRLTSRPGHDRSSCFAAEQLVNLARGEVDPGARSQALAHLIRCSDCSRELQMLGSLHEWSQIAVAEPGALSQPSSGDGRGGNGATALRAGRGRVAGFGELPLSVLAGFGAVVLAVLALGVWALLLLGETRRLNEELEQSLRARTEATAVASTLDEANAQLAAIRDERDRLRRTVRELGARVERLSGPFVNLPIIELDLRRAERRGDVLTRQAIVVPEAARWFTLVVTLPRTENQESYAIEVLDTGADLLWEDSSLLPAGRGRFTFTLPTERFARGIFHLRFHGTSGDERQLLEEVSIEISRG